MQQAEHHPCMDKDILRWRQRRRQVRDGVVCTVAQLHSAVLVLLGIVSLESQYHTGTTLPHRYLAHLSCRHCKNCQRSAGFVSATKRDRQGAAQVTLVGGDFTLVPAHPRDTVERDIKKKKQLQQFSLTGKFHYQKASIT